MQKNKMAEKQDPKCVTYQVLPSGLSHTITPGLQLHYNVEFAKLWEFVTLGIHDFPEFRKLWRLSFCIPNSLKINCRRIAIGLELA